MRRLVWKKVKEPDSPAFSYQTQTADGSWAEVSYMSNTEIYGVAWAGPDDEAIREIYQPIALQRPTSLRKVIEYLQSAFKEPTELADEAMLDVQIQMEAILRRYEITGILDYREAHSALRRLPRQEAEAKIAEWWARNPGPDDPAIEPEEEAL